MAGELGYDTGPYVSLAAFCDQVIEGKDGVLSLIRVIDRLTITAAGSEAPDQLPPGQIATTLVISLKAGQARGAQHVGVSFEQPDGTSRGGTELSMNFAPGKHGGVNLISPVQLNVETPGLYWANISVNGRLVTRIPLMVNYQFMR